MAGGLVKTLDPRIHGGILGDWKDPAQQKYLEANGIEPLDFVVVNLYPFQEVVKADPENLRMAVDNIDIGGVALIRAAGKGAFVNDGVVPVTSPLPYAAGELALETKGYGGNQLRQRPARGAF